VSAAPPVPTGPAGPSQATGPAGPSQATGPAGPSQAPGPAGPPSAPGAAGLLHRASERLAWAAVFGLLGLAVLTTLDVLLRWLFAKPIPGVVDVVTLAGAVLLAACMPWIAASRGHIAIDALGRAAGPRAKRALDLFGALVTVAFFAVLAWQYVGFAREMYETGERMPVLRWPVWPWWTAVAACIAFTALVAAATLPVRGVRR
jgi:TRAP-type C4-dicarboxylate transport system permease small subunit